MSGMGLQCEEHPSRSTYIINHNITNQHRSDLIDDDERTSKAMKDLLIALHLILLCYCCFSTKEGLVVVESFVFSRQQQHQQHHRRHDVIAAEDRASTLTTSQLLLPSSVQRRSSLKQQQQSRLHSTSDDDDDNALFTQVISDVDDTLKSSGGVNVAGVALGGIDVQYARGDFYPGVAEFMLHVSLNGGSNHDHDGIMGQQRSGNNLDDYYPPPKVAILTARAEEFKVALELKQNSALAVQFRKAGEAVGVSGWGLGPVLYGSVAEWIVQNRKGQRKFTNFERLLQQDPTGRIMQYVYVGDTGELDQEAGETMLREYPEVVRAVFLHCVSDRRAFFVEVPPPKMIEGRPLVFFRTYVGAAVAAVQLGFMTTQGLKAVMEAACRDLDNVPRSSDKWIDLARDIDRANQLLGV